MLTVKYEEYHNDYHKKHHVEKFQNLTQLEDWIFGQMQRDYRNDNIVLYFPQSAERMTHITFSPSYTSPTYYINLIQSDEGVIFSDGTYTCGRKHVSKATLDWLVHCKKRRDTPTFTFVV